MIGFLVSAERRRQLVVDASKSRAEQGSLAAGVGLVIFYNLVGVLDIVSTSLAIGLGLAEEANPVLKAIMDHAGPGWIWAKILLQSVVSAMVIWFPHRFVLTVFGAATVMNAWVVYNNFVIIAAG
ncbi:MAG: DUF5658 family protein [Pseudomonadota bacterium]